MLSIAILAASCGSGGGQEEASAVVEAEAAETATTARENGTASDVESSGGAADEPSTTVPAPNEADASEAETTLVSTNYVVSSEAAAGYERIESGDGGVGFVVPEGWSLRTDRQTSVHLNTAIIDLALDVGAGASFLSAIAGGGGDQPGVWVAVVDVLVPVDNETLEAALITRVQQRGGCELGEVEDYATDLLVGRALALEECGETGHAVSLVIGRLRADEQVLIFIEASLIDLPHFLDFGVLLEDITVDPAALR